MPLHARATWRALCVALLLVVPATETCLASEAGAAAGELYHERFRPQLHFSPPTQWMNDPNGMVYVDGEYHLFYQYHPYSSRWGPMHWGHAVSGDLVHWQHLPIALYPDEHGAIFSGSAVYDVANASGLGTKSHPPLIAVFAYHSHEAERQGSIAIESEGLAYSLDRGRSWSKYAGNPVLANPGLRHFRDPKVFWHAGSRRWIMVLASQDHVKFYSSRNLRQWRFESDFGAGQGAHGGIWECPDLFEMAIEGEAARRYVLLSSVNPGAPNGGSGTQYFVGRFDGHRFAPDERHQPRPSGAAQWLDYGTDNYAGVSWSGVPAADGRRLMLGWMSNWNYAQDVPTERWRSAMTLPRELRLVRGARGLELRSSPVAELKSLRVRDTTLPAGSVAVPTELIDQNLDAAGRLEVELTLSFEAATRVTFRIGNRLGEQLLVRIDRAHHQLELDRSAAGVSDFNAEFTRPQTAPIDAASATLQLRMILDRSSVELFVNDGATVMTALVFPGAPYDSVVLSADRPVELRSGNAYALESIWKDAIPTVKEAVK
jgi:fructan beta-fructosidase